MPVGASRAGVPTELHVSPGAFHGFNLVAAASVLQSALRDQGDAHLSRFSPTRRSVKLCEGTSNG